jgi:Ca-activated chloride channel family protein
MLLTESQYVDDWDYLAVVNLAQEAKGTDREGYRSEFINLVKTYGLLSSAKSRKR